METQSNLNYNRIASAIEYIQHHFKEQPNLDEVAEKIHLSPAHFQRLFTDWAGTSPKKFLQYISLQYAKKLLDDNKELTLFDAAYHTGLSSSSRLHDLFINIEGMTPAEYKNGGQFLKINYRYADSPFGPIIIASTAKGVCYIAFESNEAKAFTDLQAKFPNALFQQRADDLQQMPSPFFKTIGLLFHRLNYISKAPTFNCVCGRVYSKFPWGNWLHMEQ